MKRPFRGDPYPLIVTAVAAAIVGLALFLAYSFSREREIVLGQAGRDLQHSAILIAQSFEGTLRTADVLLESGAAMLAGRPGEEAVRRFLADAVIRLPEAQNLYLVSPSGEVLATALTRREPRLGIGGRALDRLRAGERSAILVLEASAEGGKQVALLRGYEVDGRFAGCLASLFSNAVLAERMSLLMGESVALVEVHDAEGTILERRYRQAGGSALASALRAEWTLRSYPLRIAAYRDRSAALGAWRKSIAPILAIASGFAVLVAFLAVYGLALHRGAKEAARLGRELLEKETLFAEVNHRVKNNLLIVQGLLGLGIEEAERRPEAAVHILRSSEDRIRSIAVLHERLYRRASSGSADLGDYLASLVDTLKESYAVGGGIEIAVQADSDLMVSLNAAVPCALIVNELVTNALKHAFPDGRTGSIRITARRGDGGAIELAVADDGVGMPEAPAEGPAAGLGLTLIRLLSQQLGAEVSRSGSKGHGTSWILLIPPAGPSARAPAAEPAAAKGPADP